MLYEKYGNWSFGIECETDYKFQLPEQTKDGVKKRPVIRSGIILSFKRDGKEVMYVYPDIGDDEMRTVEIVTNPIRIKEMDIHKSNIMVIKFLQALLKEFFGKELTKLAFYEKFKAFKAVNAANPYIANLTVVMLVAAVEIRGYISDNLHKQISFGVPISQIPNFVDPLLYPDLESDWYYPGRYNSDCPIAYSNNEKEAYNFLVSAALQYYTILCKYSNNPQGSLAKNSWKFMPRTPPSKVLEIIVNPKHLIEVKALICKFLFGILPKINNSIINQAYQDLIENNETVGGHAKSIVEIKENEDENNTLSMFVFEIRQPGLEFEDYFN